MELKVQDKLFFLDNVMS